MYGSANTIIHSDNKLMADAGNPLDAGQFKWLSFELDGGSTGKEIDLNITSEGGDGAWRMIGFVMKKQQ